MALLTVFQILLLDLGENVVSQDNSNLVSSKDSPFTVLLLLGNGQSIGIGIICQNL